MHIETARSHQTLKDGTERVYQRHLLRRSYREGGKVRKQTLANLSHLPDEAIAALRLVLGGKTVVDADAALQVERSAGHGHVAAVHTIVRQLGLPGLLGPACRERDLAYALLVSRVVRPRSKLSTIGWWDDVTLGADLGVAGASTDEVYQAMDWLVGRQDHIEAELARRHLQAGGIAMFDLSSSWMEGSHCELACFGHSRDGKRGKPQIEYGLLCDPAGRPVAVRVFAGNTADPTAFTQAVEVVRGSFDLRRLILVGDRGMITSARIGDLRATPGMAWITALRAPTVKKLAQDGGPLQLGLFDQTDLAEICSPDYPGERLVACRNPLLATERARKRADLLAPRPGRHRRRSCPGRHLRHPHIRPGADPGRARHRRRLQEPRLRRTRLPPHQGRRPGPAAHLAPAGRPGPRPRAAVHAGLLPGLAPAQRLGAADLHRRAPPSAGGPRRPRTTFTRRPGQSRPQDRRQRPADAQLPGPARPPRHAHPRHHHHQRPDPRQAHHPHANPPPRLRPAQHPHPNHPHVDTTTAASNNEPPGQQGFTHPTPRNFGLKVTVNRSKKPTCPRITCQGADVHALKNPTSVCHSTPGRPGSGASRSVTSAGWISRVSPPIFSGVG